jgi:hypothetical protein
VTLGVWLHSRSPSPPLRLAERMDAVLGDRCATDSTEATEQCIAAAEGLLVDLLTRPSAGRESALDLLTVDALITYAFEAAAVDADMLPSRADGAMRRLAAAVR